MSGQCTIMHTAQMVMHCAGGGMSGMSRGRRMPRPSGPSSAPWGWA